MHVVHIALGAVEEDALGVIQHLFHRPAGKAGPVGGDLAAAHHIRVVAEVHQGDAFSTLAVKPQHIDPLVHIANGGHNVGIVHAGIGADGAVLHSEAADKGDVGRLADAVAHLRRLQIIQGQLCRVCQLAFDRLGVFNFHRFCGVGV